MSGTLALLRFPGLQARHAVTTRVGGVSSGAYATLNLGLSTGDDPAAVAENRRRVLRALGADEQRLALLHQVHGAQVVVAEEARPPGERRGDALIGIDPEWTLAVSIADCVPVLLHDPETGAAAAIHAGWRGAAAGVATATLAALKQRYRVDPASLIAAIGPSISLHRYQVGPEVVQALRDAGAPADAWQPDPSTGGRYLASVATAVRAELIRGGVPPASIVQQGGCTASDSERWFSHRRDRGVSGRMWALVRPGPSGSA